jgi:hypothetical protein
MNSRKTLSLGDIEIDLDDLFADIERYQQFKELRKDHSYVADLIRLLSPRPGGLSRRMILHDLERQRRKDGLPIPPKFEEAVQSSYNQHSRDSAVFRKRNLPESEAIFYSPEGKGSGRWAVNREHAARWLKAQLQRDDAEQA